jgi:hypothetical protein
MRTGPCYAPAPIPMKLIHLDTRTNIALVACACGGHALIPTTGATEAQPAKGRCPLCTRTLDYPNDLEK